MRAEVYREPPPDVEFPYFEVSYYDKPESAVIKIKTTDGRSKRWPDSSQGIHDDGSIISCQPSDDETQHNWRQKLGELLRDRFLLADTHLGGVICASSL